jgi:hypothetical protein
MINATTKEKLHSKGLSLSKVHTDDLSEAGTPHSKYEVHPEGIMCTTAPPAMELSLRQVKVRWNRTSRGFKPIVSITLCTLEGRRYQLSALIWRHVRHQLLQTACSACRRSKTSLPELPTSRCDNAAPQSTTRRKHQPAMENMQNGGLLAPDQVYKGCVLWLRLSAAQPWPTH